MKICSCCLECGGSLLHFTVFSATAPCCSLREVPSVSSRSRRHECQPKWFVWRVRLVSVGDIWCYVEYFWGAQEARTIRYCSLIFALIYILIYYIYANQLGLCQGLQFEALFSNKQDCIWKRAAVNTGQVFEHLLAAAAKRYKSVFAKIHSSTWLGQEVINYGSRYQ